MRNSKRTCARCNKTRRVKDTITHNEYGVCSTCFATLGLKTFPSLLPQPNLAREVNAFDLYLSEAVNKYALRDFRGLLF